MPESAFVALTLNASALLASTLILDLLLSFASGRASLGRKLAAGGLLSLAGIAVMAVPFELQPGLVFDVRSVLVSTAALFYGPIPGGIVMAATATFRLVQGGVGTAVGVSVVLIAGAIGLLFRSRLRGGLAAVGWRPLLLMGVVVHVAMLLAMVGLPRELVAGVLSDISVPVLTIYPALTVVVGRLMTRRFRLELIHRDLAESEARFRALFQDSHVIMLLIDPASGEIVDANAAAERHYGWTIDKLRSLRLDEIELASSDEIAASLEQTRRSRGRSLIVTHRRKDGSIRQAESFSGPVRLNDRELLYSVLVDVTERQRTATERAEEVEQRERTRLKEEREQRRVRLAALNQLEDAVEARKRTEEALSRVREQQRLLRESQRVARVGSWEVDLRSGRVGGTDEAFDLAGLDRATFAGSVEAVEPLFPQEQRDRLRAWFAKLAEGVEAEELRLELLSPDGDPRYLSLQGGAVRGDDGTAVRVVGTVRDVSAETIAQSEIQQLSAAVEQSPESIVITDVAANIEYVNAAFERTTGYSAEDAIGANPRILGSGKTPESTFQEMWHTITAGRTWRGEFVNRRKDGREFVEIATISPLSDAAGNVTHYVAVKQDVTQRKALEQELEAYRYRLEEMVEQRTQELRVQRERAEAANRAKGRFLANMSHEIRTPMNAIVGLSHLLLGTPVTDAQRANLERIDHAARHLLSIISDVLDLSRIDEGHMPIGHDNFELTSVLDHVRSILAGQAAEKGLAFEIDASDVPTWLRGDSIRIRQALLNLVGNAVKFTDQGRVRLRARLLSEDEFGLHVRFEVEDTGPGIPPDRSANVFEAFEQGDVSSTRRYGGTGLGLAISKRLVELMAGTIGFDSELGRGSTFWFELRLQRALGPLPEIARRLPVDPSTFRGRRVLLVEDNEVNREVAAELLSAAGFEVETASNGVFAVDRVTADPKRYDLIMMDLQMPVLDGLAASRRIRAVAGAEDVPIVALTANAFDDDRAASQAAGMNDFVAKPVDPAELFAVIRRWVAPRGTESPRQVDATGNAPSTRPVPAEASPDDFDLGGFHELVAQHDVIAIEIADEHGDALRALLGTDADLVVRALHAFEFERARELLAAHQH